MSALDFTWVALLVLILQPIIARRFSDTRRRAAISAIERGRQSRLILLVHRQETVSFFGIPVLRYIDLADAESVARAIELTSPETPIDIVLHTPGGLLIASVQIARALRRHLGKVTVFVPHYAMSGGTLIALAADEIVMSPNAMLGAVDPQVDGMPASSLLKVVADKPIADIDDATLIMADMGRKAIDEIAREVQALLPDATPAETAARIARTLTEGRWTHDYGLSAHEVAEIGLCVTQEMPREVMSLMNLYQQPFRRVPGVEFSPHRRDPISGSGKRYSKQRVD